MANLNRRRLFGLLPALPLAAAAVPAVGALASPLRPFAVGHISDTEPLILATSDGNSLREWRVVGADWVEFWRMWRDARGAWWTDADVAATLGIPFDGEA